MTGQADIQWYIAREGKQHGPLSDAEMRTFVAQGHLKPTDLIWRPGFADWRPAPAVFPFPQPEAPTAAPNPTTQARRADPPRGAPATAAAMPQHSFEPQRIRVAQGSDDNRKSGARRALGMVVLLALLGGGGWYVWRSGAITSLTDSFSSSKEGEQVPTVAAPDGSTATVAATESPPAPAVSTAEVDAGAQELDSKFAKMAAWSVVKREFPDWYGEQLRQAAKLSAEKQPEQAVNKQLAEALIALRRQHANDALSASTDSLRRSLARSR